MKWQLALMVSVCLLVFLRIGIFHYYLIRNSKSLEFKPCKYPPDPVELWTLSHTYLLSTDNIARSLSNVSTEKNKHNISIKCLDLITSTKDFTWNRTFGNFIFDTSSSGLKFRNLYIICSGSLTQWLNYRSY